MCRRPWATFFFAALMLVIVQQSVLADGVERIVWDKKPIPITLAKNQERMVTFPGDVEVGVPQRLSEVLRTQSANNTVYWLANEVFEPARIQVKDVATGQIYMIDLRANDAPGVSYAAIQVILPHVQAGAASVSATEAEINYVTLTRYAAQQLFAPRRLLKELSGVHRVALSNTAISLYRGGAVEAVPIISWKSASFHVTAISLHNITSSVVKLDPRKLRGDWICATFHQQRLAPQGSTGRDTTVVYVVSTRSFEDAIGPWFNSVHANVSMAR
jgi:integrating conjugative element protein (TIGR03749 family)